MAAESLAVSKFVRRVRVLVARSPTWTYPERPIASAVSMPVERVDTMPAFKIDARRPWVSSKPMYYDPSFRFEGILSKVLYGMSVLNTTHWPNRPMRAGAFASASTRAHVMLD